MDRDEMSAVLCRHSEELRLRGVTRLGLFGSVLRGDERPDSDVDLLVDFEENSTLSLIDVADLRLRLCELLGRDVELVQRSMLKPFLRDGIIAEARDVL